MTVSAVIFDWDGTLVDSHEAHFLAMRDTLHGFGLTLERSWAQSHQGTSTEEAIALLAAEQSRPVPEPADAVAKRCTLAYLDHLDQVHPVPWVVDLARSLAGHVRTAVASGGSAEAIRPTMRALGLADLFPVLVTREDVDHGKPSPDLFLLAARRLGAPADECLVVEDSDEGVEAARRAGMRVIDVRSRPAHIVHPTAER
ncbi:HAD family hydrolase [Kitasatospora sp. NPDC098652]|uniref:HAD family hydrolase n=1 Tax=Kitasatospora sp. NPDC098652 TaxID=3364095 RepID=UPI0038056ACA